MWGNISQLRDFQKDEILIDDLFIFIAFWDNGGDDNSIETNELRFLKNFFVNKGPAKGQCHAKPLDLNSHYN